MKKTMSRWLGLIAVMALVIAACSPSGGDATTTEGATATTEGATATTEGATATTEGGGDEGGGDMPGEGVEITMGRADWSTGYFQAYVYQALLEELGYTVSDPALLELGPSLAYLSMAQGDIDFWPNSWYPGHVSWFEPELPDGSFVGDHLTIYGPAPDAAGDFAPRFTEDPGEMVAGGLQGYLITKTFAEEFGITTMDEFNANPDAIAAYDAQDPTPGNGIADIYGCQESWTCDNIILSQIAFGDGTTPWSNIQEAIAGYDPMVAEATVKANAGEPMIIYTWTPSAYITELRPGDNVLWLGVDAVLDDSNPSGQDGGENHTQLPGTANISAETCPSAADKGICQLGWIAADILVTANTEFADANPAAAALFAQVQLSVLDVSLANVAQSAGADTNDAIRGLADDWIALNRGVADNWLTEARAAAG